MYSSIKRKNDTWRVTITKQEPDSNVLTEYLITGIWINVTYIPSFISETHYIYFVVNI